jgi:hypothetical protein
MISLKILLFNHKKDFQGRTKQLLKDFTYPVAKAGIEYMKLSFPLISNKTDSLFTL